MSALTKTLASIAAENEELKARAANLANPLHLEKLAREAAEASARQAWRLSMGRYGGDR